MRQNLCKLNNCLEIEFIAHKARQKRRKEIKGRERNGSVA